MTNPVWAARVPLAMDNQRNVSDQGFVILAYLLAGLLLYGGLGWLLDQWLHTNWFTPIGIILGFVLSMYLIIKRYNLTNPTTDKTKESK